LAWAFATLISATALATTTAYLANGTPAGVGGASAQAARSVNPNEIYVDKLFRSTPAAETAAAPAAASENANAANAAAPSGANAGNPGQTRAEVSRLWTADFRADQDLSAGDRAYVAQLVAARTGLSQADAEKRVNEVVTEAKTALDHARRAAAKLSFWLTAALLFGAFAASLAAAEGGALRDGTWNDRVLTPRTI
jgi:hypothetical protein